MHQKPQNISTPTTYDQINWKESTLVDKSDTSHNKLVVAWLMEEAHPTSAEGNDYADNVPKRFMSGDLSIDYLPHWDYYQVGSFNLKLPSTQEQLQEDIRRVKQIEDRLA